MNPPTDAQVKDPVQLSRYLRGMAERLGAMDQVQRETVTTLATYNRPDSTPAERLPDTEIARLGLQDVQRVHNYNATAAPTTSDNAAQGYGSGSFWLYPNLPGVWLCVYADQSTASWIKLN